MALTDDKKKEVLDKLSFLNTVQCPICKSIQWSVSDSIFEIREYNQGKIPFGGKLTLMPLIAVRCNKCTHTIFFNAITLGVVQSNEKADSQTT